MGGWWGNKWFENNWWGNNWWAGGGVQPVSGGGDGGILALCSMRKRRKFPVCEAIRRPTLPPMAVILAAFEDDDET